MKYGSWINVKDSLPDFIKKENGLLEDYSENVFTTNGKDIFIMALSLGTKFC